MCCDDLREPKQPATLGELIDRIGADKEEFMRGLDRISKNVSVMQWTTDKPTKHGWYWFRNWNRETTPCLVQVADVFGRGLEVCFVTGHRVLLKDVHSEWCGPLEVPE